MWLIKKKEKHGKYNSSTQLGGIETFLDKKLSDFFIKIFNSI